MADRTSRTAETREAYRTKVTWKDHLLYLIQIHKKELSTLDTNCITRSSDMTNVSSKFREGWEPVKAEDHPELKIISDVDSKFKGNVEVGGLLLCKNSKENMDARRDYQQNQAKSQMQAVDNSY